MKTLYSYLTTDILAKTCSTSQHVVEVWLALLPSAPGSSVKSQLHGQGEKAYTQPEHREKLAMHLRSTCDEWQAKKADLMPAKLNEGVALH